MSKPLSRKHVEDYESDDGFVEDAPKSKKQKKDLKPKKAVDTTIQKDDDGNDYWEISGKRRVTVSEFKKMTMVNLREYYEKDGQTLPGKKGISLTVEQYTALIDILPDIERVLKQKGVTVPRPQYDKKPTPTEDEQEEDEAVATDEDDVEVGESSKNRGRLEKFKLKKNHEATSDEDDD